MLFNPNQGSFLRLGRRYAERTKDIAFWIGAGISQPAGLPSWSELRDILADEAKQELLTAEASKVDEIEDRLERLGSDASLWDSFETLRDVLGAAKYRSAIREVFEKAERVDPPRVYEELWKLDGVKSVLTLNIDGMARRSHRLIRSHEDSMEFSGKDAGPYIHRVSQRKPFIANLHGVHENADSWVFTKGDLSHLLSNSQYRQFIDYILKDLTIVFLGISADDLAVGGFLEEMTRSHVDLDQHFWITSRNDGTTAKWAAKTQLQVINYQPTRASDDTIDHTTAIVEILESLKNFVSRDSAAPAVVGSVARSTKIRTPKELIELDNDDQLRGELAGYARDILARNSGNTDSAEYKEFLKKYSRAVYMSWHVTTEAPSNVFLGYVVREKISSNPFSSIWRISDSESNDYALKIIKIENLEKGPQLESFRRGVQSLRYLTKAKVPGTAEIVDAVEIPSCMIMKFVDGANLAQIALDSKFDFWLDGIKVLCNVCDHIENSHALPESVLHRDVRPSNIMVPRFYWDEEACEAFEGGSRHSVTLLNYDMSWHSNAQGESISGSTDEAAYYAPEQLPDGNAEAARSALVDSYGIGMTAYFCATGKPPPSGGSKSLDWLGLISSGVRQDPKVKWKSAAARLRWLIRSSTNPESQLRITVRTFGAILSQIDRALGGKLTSITPDICAEELFARAFDNSYLSSDDGATFTRIGRPGRLCALKGSIKSNSVLLTFHNQLNPEADWSKVEKTWPDRLASAVGILENDGWAIGPGTKYVNKTIYLEASKDVGGILANLDKTAERLGKAVEMIRLD